MKDIEKIKSEDLGCQVQDANPGNFAIEQEVAQLVGATVPAPTEPSDDDARELGAQLLVFLRRALTPIQTALRTAVAAIYAHLDSRCTAYTPAAYDPFRLPAGPYDPMRPFVPRTLPNLLTAITAFSARKISNGSAPNDGIPDGTSLARLLTTDKANILAIVDDTYNWELNGRIDSIFSAFTGLKRLKLNCTKATTDFDRLSSSIEEFEVPELEEYIHATGQNRHNITMVPKCNAETFNLPKLKTYKGWVETSWGNGVISDCPNCKEFRAPLWSSYINQDTRWPAIKNCPKLELFYCPSINAIGMGGAGEDCPELIDIVFKAYPSSCNLGSWNPTNVLADADKTATFLQNFKEHIALRLTSNGRGLTLTLSQAVFDTIWNQDGTPKSTDPDSVIYQINKIIKTDKHWSVNRA